MRRIEAIIKPSKLEAVQRALGAVCVREAAVSEVKRFAREAARAESPGGEPHALAFLPRVKLELVVDDGLVPTVISTIQRAAKTGRDEGWMMFVLAAGEHP